jgi:hypothetical protein
MANSKLALIGPIIALFVPIVSLGKSLTIPSRRESWSVIAVIGHPVFGPTIYF